ncbi:MAG: oligosaccharide flippase family protein [Bacteroidales bacterium]|nr:oligosaccharide flippase family protein [Bacteroidales bacterium]
MPKFNVDLRGLLYIGNLTGGYFITTILNNALPFLFLPILTRYLSPAEYGSLALFTLYLALSNTLSGSSIPVVISKYFYNSEKEYIAKIIGNSILISAILSLTTMLLILIAYPFLKNFFDIPIFWLLVIPPTSFAFILFSMGLTVMRNSKKVLTFGTHQIGNTTINLILSILFVVILLWSWQGRAWGIILSFFISAIGSFYYLRKNAYISFEISKKIINIILRVVIPLIPNSFQTVIISLVGYFFIEHYYTKELLGVYSIGFQITIMIKLLIDTLSMSWGPYLYEQLSNGKSINKLYLTRLIYVLVGIVFSGVLFINLSSGIILKIMTTPDYYGAREFIPWFSLGLLFQGFYVFLFPILINHEKQKYISIVTFGNMLITIALNIWFIKLFGYIGISYVFCITYFIMFIAFFWQTQKVMPMPWFKALKIWK